MLSRFKNLYHFTLAVLGLLAIFAVQANTAQAAASLSNIKVTPGNFSATITYQTSSPVPSYLWYGPSLAMVSSLADPTPKTDHKITLGNLSPNTTYYFHIHLSGATPTPSDLKLYSSFYTSTSLSTRLLQDRLTQLQSQLSLLQGSSSVLSPLSSVLSFSKNLKQGMTDPSVKELQKILNQDKRTQVSSSGSGSPGLETTYFGPATKRAVIKFQELYRADILTPNNLTKGTGLVYGSTRNKLNAILAASLKLQMPSTQVATAGNAGGYGGASSAGGGSTSAGAGSSAASSGSTSAGAGSSGSTSGSTPSPSPSPTPSVNPTPSPAPVSPTPTPAPTATGGNSASAYQGFTVPGLSTINAQILTSKSAGQTPFVLHVSGSPTTAVGTTRPYEDLEYRWNFGDSLNVLVNNPVTGQTVDANVDQVGPEASYFYRQPGTYTVTMTVRGWNGSSYVQNSTTAQVVVSAWSGADRYIDPVAGNDSNDGLSASTPWQSWGSAKTWLTGANQRGIFLKRGTTLIADNQMDLTKVGTRIRSYGTGAQPIIKAANVFAGTNIIVFWANKVEVGDVVIEDITLDGNGDKATLIGAYSKFPVHDIAFINTTLTVQTSRSLVSFSGGGGGPKNNQRISFWNTIFESNHSATAWYIPDAEWVSIIGGSFSGGESNGILDHHIYPNHIDHNLFRWINFDTAFVRNFCINTNAPNNGDITQWVLMDGNDCDRLNNGIDVSNSGTAMPGYFDHFIIQNSAIHDLGLGGQGYAMILGNVHKITIRDNFFYNIPITIFAISDPNIQPKIYRNKIYHQNNASAIIELGGGVKIPASGNAVFKDNVIVSMSSVTAPCCEMFMRFHSFAQTEWLIDGNQYWFPNDPKPFVDYMGGTLVRKAFAEWQSAGFDVNGTYANPNWADPANGNFSLNGSIPSSAPAPTPSPSPSATPTPIVYTITASAGAGGTISPSGLVSVTSGDSQAFAITPSSGYQISAVMVDGSNAGSPFAYTFTNATAAHSISASFSAITTPSPSASPSGITSPSGLTAYWPLDGNANDAIGSNNGTLQNGPTFTIGKIGQAISMDENDDKVALSSSMDFSATSFSISMWAKTSSVNSNRAIYEKTGDGGDAKIWLATVASGEQMRLYIADSTEGGFGGITNERIINNGVWHHYVATFDYGTKAIDLFVDGVSAGGGTGPLGDIDINPQYHYIGYFSVSNTAWGGAMDDVRIYNRVLSASEVSALYNNGSGVASISVPSLDISHSSFETSSPYLANTLEQLLEILRQMGLNN